MDKSRLTSNVDDDDDSQDDIKMTNDDFQNAEKARNRERRRKVYHDQVQAREQLGIIFGGWFIGKGFNSITSSLERESAYFRIKSTLASLSRIKYMREVKVSSELLTSAETVQAIIYEESLRILNDHSMKLMLSHRLQYARHLEEHLEK